MRYFLTTLAASLCLLVLSIIPAQAQPVPVSLSDLSDRAPGTTFEIPVQIQTELDGTEGDENDGVIAFDLTIEYDGSLLDITGVNSEGTLAEGWSITPNTSETDQVSVSGSSTTPLVGGPGTLIYLEASINEGATGTSPLTFVELKFNSEEVPSTATSGSVSTGDVPSNRNLIINEIHADPASSSDCDDFGKPSDCGDANNDGMRDGSEDEFVEIINGGSEAIDLGGYTLSDNNGVRLTFPAGTTLDPNVAAVVFGGGTPTGIPGLVFTANPLGLNNDGDTITLNDSAGNIVAAVTYSDGAIQDQSVTRSPDLGGPFALHIEASPSDALYSPGRMLDGTALPVELNSFDAVRDGRDVVLQWSTASETNNSGFAVQHRVNGAFQDIAFVEGAGTATTPQHYDYRIADLPTGTHVFRLEQVDFDGTTTPSQEVEVTIPLDKRFILESAYPNPFRAEATFTLKVQETQEVRVTLFNALGQRVQNIFAGTVRAGTPATFAIQGTTLPSGVYLYRVQGRTFSTSKQITRVK